MTLTKRIAREARYFFSESVVVVVVLELLPEPDEPGVVMVVVLELLLGADFPSAPEAPCGPAGPGTGVVVGVGDDGTATG